MIDNPVSAENTSFFWGIAFAINVTLGAVSFFWVIKKKLTIEQQSILGWIGWWSFANALSLVINYVAGPSDPFSYHQIGVLTETMINLGYVSLAITFTDYDSK